LAKLDELAVSVESECHEVSPSFFAQQIEPLLIKGSFVVLSEEAATRVKTQNGLMKVFSESRCHPVNKQAILFSHRQAFTYLIRPTYTHEWACRKDPTHEAGYYGTVLKATPRCTGDRKYVYLQLAREQKELVALREQTIPMSDGLGPSEGTIERPEIREETTSTNIRLKDGERVLVVLPSSAGAEKETGKVRVLLMRIQIVDEREEKERESKTVKN
jgi:hypothetical protein